MNAIAAPLDIKLMNATALSLYVVCALVALGLAVAWLLQSPFFAIQ